MRVPEQSAIGKLAALAALIALVGAGLGSCAASTPIKVTWDEREDLAQFRTWDWIDGDAVLVRAPFGDDPETAAQLSALLASALRGRGLEHSPGSGELRVAALMVGVRSYQVSSRARATQTLHSYHDIGGFEVQADELVRRPVDRCRVVIYLTGPRQERILWQARSDQRYSDGCARHLGDAVSRLLAGYPPVPPERAAPGSR